MASADEINEYLAGGGEVTRVPEGASGMPQGFSDADWDWRIKHPAEPDVWAFPGFVPRLVPLRALGVNVTPISHDRQHTERG